MQRVIVSHGRSLATLEIEGVVSLDSVICEAIGAAAVRLAGVNVRLEDGSVKIDLGYMVGERGDAPLLFASVTIETV